MNYDFFHLKRNRKLKLRFHPSLHPTPFLEMKVFYSDAFDQKAYVDHSDLLNQAKVSHIQTKKFSQKKKFVKILLFPRLQLGPTFSFSTSMQWLRCIAVVSPERRFARRRFARTESRFARTESRFARTESRFARNKRRFARTESRFARFLF